MRVEAFSFEKMTHFETNEALEGAGAYSLHRRMGKAPRCRRRAFHPTQEK